MSNQNDLQRFIAAQESKYESALKEIRQGKKQTHWMWFVFPQIQGLSLSDTAKFYAIHNIEEAAAFINHPVLGSRLIAICKELLLLGNNNAFSILGSPDDMKLKSSMTLFGALQNPDPVFQQVLDKFYGGAKDKKTLRIINQ